MSKIPTFELFKKTFTNGSGRKDRRFIDTYGDISFEEAYPIYIKKITHLFSTNDRIVEFENFLKANGVIETQSNKSESRYYYWNGMKYRFSGHIYPTGSMTSEFCIDLTADPHLVYTIDF